KAPVSAPWWQSWEVPSSDLQNFCSCLPCVVSSFVVYYCEGNFHHPPLSVSRTSILLFHLGPHHLSHRAQRQLLGKNYRLGSLEASHLVAAPLDDLTMR